MWRSSTAVQSLRAKQFSNEVWKEIVRPYYLKWLYFPLFSARPEHFANCWNYPDADLTGPANRPAQASAPAVVFLPMCDWHTRAQRSQHMAQTFAEIGHRCLYLNPHLGREFRQPYPFSPKFALRQLQDRVVEAHVHLWREPVFHYRCLRETESRRVADVLSEALDKMGASRQVYIVSLPIWGDVARLLRRQYDSMIIYDCHDLIEGFGSYADSIVEAEAALMQDADLILFSSRWLAARVLERFPCLKHRSELVPNAADLNHFPLCAPRFPAADNPHPVTVGYAGALNVWLDVDALDFAARQKPEWRFELVGRVESDRVRRLEARPNVRFLGERSYDDLPKLFQNWDVAGIPFLINDLTKATNPIKLYEYLAAGLPVATSALPEVEPFSHLVYRYETPAEFVGAIHAALREDPALRRRRREAVQQETWRARCLLLESQFDQRWAKAGAPRTVG